MEGGLEAKLVVLGTQGTLDLLSVLDAPPPPQSARDRSEPNKIPKQHRHPTDQRLNISPAELSESVR